MPDMRSVSICCVLVGSVLTSCCFAAHPPAAVPPDPGRLEQPRPLPQPADLGRKPLNTYGSLETTIQSIRAHRPLDLGAEHWRRAHPRGTHADWAKQARAVLEHGLAYDPG